MPYRSGASRITLHDAAGSTTLTRSPFADTPSNARGTIRSGASLLFTVVHSANLLLLTTPPEDLVWAMGWFLQPFERLGWPVERLGFTLLLALRFLPLVQEEMQNLLRSLATRAVNLKRLGWRGGLGLALARGPYPHRAKMPRRLNISSQW